MKKLISKENYMEQSKKIILDFMKATDLKNIEDLRTYNFHKIWGNSTLNKEYGNGKSYEDGDCTKLAYAVAWELWGEELKKVLPDYTFEKLLNEEYFSGDTICTFNTVFGSSTIRNDVLHKLSLTDIETKELEKFERLYQTIGNFYILPNKTIDGISPNKYRGRYWGWKDFFDTFIKELTKYYDKTCEDILFCRIIEENAFFFEKEISNSVDKFCELFFLDKNFVLENSRFNHTQLTDKNVGEYKKFAFGYIAKATELINKRSLKLVQELKEKLKDTREFKGYL